MKRPFHGLFGRDRREPARKASEAQGSVASQQAGPFWVYVVDRAATGSPPSADGSRTHRVVSFLPPDEVRTIGIPGEAICGFFTSEADASAENFVQNRIFVDFMQRTIGRAGLDDPALRDAGRQQREGYVYVIDLRTPEGPQGTVPPADIVGGFNVVDGSLVPGAYRANPKHRILTKDGFFRLPPTLHRALISAAVAAASPSPEATAPTIPLEGS